MKYLLLCLCLLTACVQSSLKKEETFPELHYHHLSEFPDDLPPCRLYFDVVTEKEVCLKRAPNEEIDQRFPNQRERFISTGFIRYFFKYADGTSILIEQYRPLSLFDE